MANLIPTPQYRVAGLPTVYEVLGLPMVNNLAAWKKSVFTGKLKGFHTLRTYDSVEGALKATLKYGTPFLCKVNKAGELVLAWTNEEDKN